MIINKKIETNNVYLENLNRSNISSNYYSWLNNIENNKFTQINNINYNKDTIIEYINQINKSNNQLIFGIFFKSNKTHIGNIKININFKHLTGEIGILIGEKKYQGRSLGPEIINSFTEFVFEHLKLYKLVANIYENNHASIRAFKKSKWKLDAELSSEYNFFGIRKNSLKFTKFNTKYFTQFKIKKTIKQIVFIGGGDIMLNTIRHAKEKKINVFVILSPRHAHEKLPVKKNKLVNELRKLKIKYLIIDDINHIDFQKNYNKKNTLALCFGPAWIFSSKTIKKFQLGMYNFNGIPIPNYLGGAHYSWQILNENKEGGCFIQKINTKLDKGDVISAYKFKLSLNAKIPIDYFKENIKYSHVFLTYFINHLIDKGIFLSYSFENYLNQTSYFPRLNSKINSYIDWNLDCNEIVNFCNAFDEPYLGATTTINNIIVNLKNVSLYENSYYHSFSYGIVIRKIKNVLFVASKNGILKITQVNDNLNNNYLSKIKKGDRFYTKKSKIDEGKLFKPMLNSRGFLTN